MSTFKEDSKRNWVAGNGEQSSNEQIQIGCLQRIADATEAMAINHTKLIDENKWLAASRKQYREWNESLERSNAALKGHLTRLKKKIALLEAE